MIIRPTDLPELRAELAAFATSPEGAQYWQEHTELDYFKAFKVAGGELEQIARRSVSGELFFVSAAMTELVCVAGRSLPFFGMEVADIPSRSGMLLFERAPKDLTGLDAPDGQGEVSLVEIWGAAWSIPDDDFGAWIIPLATTSAHGLMMGGPVLMPFIAEDQVPPLTRDENLFDGLIRALRAAWLLMQQPLAAVSEVEADRAARKRLKRAGREPKPVRVIELRRPKSGSSTPGESGREYHHRWITRGHWRQQWYATRQVHRPVWIAPHVKGPEGAPLIGGEKVYALKR